MNGKHHQSLICKLNQLTVVNEKHGGNGCRTIAQEIWQRKKQQYESCCTRKASEQHGTR